MIYPASLANRLKYYLWSLYTPYHPYVRDAALRTGIVKHSGRQDFLIGHLAPGKKLEAFISFLVQKGFSNHFIAWHDEGEFLSLRYMENFIYQYHLRVFHDGEVRGHYEYTPECYPIRHMREEGMEPRHTDFLYMLEHWIVPFFASEE
jgi:hypothetical protein